MTASIATGAVRTGSVRSLGAKLLAASFATLAMTGCKTTDDPTRVAGWTLIDSAQRHPILVSQEPTTHLIRLGRGSNGLSSSQRAQLLDFIAHFRATDAGNSRLIVAVPSGGANEVSTMYAVGEIRAMLNDQGFGQASISVEAYSAEGAGDPPIRVSYMRYVAEPPQCGDWSTNLAYDPMNLPYPNLGCAQQRNLAVQVANPADLLGPRTETARASDRRDQVWGKYVKGAATGAAAERELGSAVGSEKISP
ncbi:MAG: CpaD family pilus assembly protein [Hyphomicrobium sp.]|nr:CpaD family pilus assembly protein [Hyphomicrobium sp.]